jgi:parallel beta-helix repeat protein
MRGKLLLALCLLLLLSFLPYAMVGQTRVNAQSLPVHNLNTGLDYATIQDAISANDTVDGNTIEVDAGTYYQPISIYKSITLVGAGSGSTIIDGNGTGVLTGLGSSRAIILLGANGISIMNLTIRNAGLGYADEQYDACISCLGSYSDINVENTVLQNAGKGMVFASGVSSITINNNTMSDILVAIDIGGTTSPTATNVTVSNNTISDAGGAGIHLDGDTSNCTILNNTVTDSSLGIDLGPNLGTYLFPTGNLIEGNVLDNNSWANILVEGPPPPYLSYQSLFLNSSYTNTFRQNNLTNSVHYNFIFVGYCAAGFVQDIDSSNTVNNKPIYYLTNVNNAEIDPSNCPDAGDLALVNCTNVTVKDFNFTSNNDGVLIAYSTNCTLTNITLGENHICITSALFESFFSDYGGLTLCGSTGNTVVDSTVYNNTCAICLCNSTGNTFYDDASINNDVPVVSDLEDPFENVSTGVFCQNSWDNGVEGNFWSGYNGTGSDGIGDTPYVIDANNTDNHPLMGTFSTFSVAAGVNVQVVSNSTVSDFQYNGTAILFNVTGVNGSTGFCNVCVPTSLLNGTLTVFVNGTEVQYSLLPISNSSISYLYFTYGHSTEQVIILPEFPEPLIIAMLMLATLLTITIYKKRHSRS